ncbi:MAG: F0F1 ATP synthase subunit B [Clostridia bacterium]|nr:F0F1 ATP synthase subunit B [Clostridia bacterium]
MQTLDIISVNLWQILISLLNLVLLFLIVKKFLFKPVKNTLEKRQKEIDERYTAAHTAEAEAEQSRAAWEEKLSGAEKEAASILQSATDHAKFRGDQMILEARERADGIVRAAQAEAELERKKATDEIKKQIVEVSGALSEKMLDREINMDDHRNLIDSFLEKIGDENE